MALTNFEGTVLREASAAWKLLNGVACIYKQPEVSMRTTLKIIRHKMCQDLNSMEPMPRNEVVHVRRSSCATFPQKDDDEKVIAQIPDGNDHIIEVIKSPNYANHPLLSGPGYQPHDIHVMLGSFLAKDSSGLAVVGINNGCRTADLIKRNKWISSYAVSGQFGKATNNFYASGKTLQKATYHNIRHHMIDRILASTQANHQRIAFASAGVGLDTQRAYELACTGLVRPENSHPLIYHAKCMKFNPPDFELEMHTINESEGFLRQFVHELGLKLHSVAVCTKIRCTKVGPFTLDMALLPKHWELESIIDNMQKASTLLKDFNLYERQPTIDVKKLI